MKQIITRHFNESIAVKKLVLEQAIEQLIQAAECCIASLERGGKIIFIGNGGSAADSQHLAAELIGRFRREREPLPALALTTDTSIITALSNDYGYATVFRRQIASLGCDNDTLVVLSTSGNSENVLQAAIQGKSQGLGVIGFLGGNGGQLLHHVDIALIVPSQRSDYVQEVHITLGHILCELIEENLFH